MKSLSVSARGKSPRNRAASSAGVSPLSPARESGRFCLPAMSCSITEGWPTSRKFHLSTHVDSPIWVLRRMRNPRGFIFLFLFLVSPSPPDSSVPRTISTSRQRGRVFMRVWHLLSVCSSPGARVFNYAKDRDPTRSASAISVEGQPFAGARGGVGPRSGPGHRTWGAHCG